MPSTDFMLSMLIFPDCKCIYLKEIFREIFVFNSCVIGLKVEYVLLS